MDKRQELQELMHFIYQIKNKCIKSLNNNKIEQDEDYFFLKPKRLGKENADKTIYFINCASKKLGFFAVQRALLMAFLFAERCGYIPVVSLKDEFVYEENGAVNGTREPFEYYYQQPGNISVESAMKSAKVIFYNKVHFQMMELCLTGIYGVYDVNDDFFNAAAAMQRKYIKLNIKTENFIESNIKKLFRDKKVLGVHVRGSDFKRNFNIHPVRVTAQEYAFQVKEIMEANKSWDKVFLATDDDEAIDIFKQTFGNQVLYYEDVIRTRGQKSVAFSNTERKAHHYKLGLEVLRDMYSLASCQGLVGGISQVCIAARITKLSRNEEYEEQRIIDKGVHHNGKAFYR